MNSKGLISLVVGLVVGGLALKLGADKLRSAQGAQKLEVVEIWAAKAEVNRGQQITEEQLTPVRFPAKAVPKWAFTDKEELVGRVARSTTYANELFHAEALLPEGAMPGLPVPEGRRAVAVKIDEGSGVDYHLEPGSRVDVVASFQVRNGNRQETVARTILENVEVGAVGARISASKSTDEESRSSMQRIRAVTLFVPPDKVPTLLLAENRGRIKLSMRGESDGSSPGRSRLISEDEIISGLLRDREAKQDQPSMGKQVSAVLGGLFKSDKPEPPQPVAAAEPPPEPAQRAPAHVMVVRQGSDRMLLGWTEMTSMTPVEIYDDGPNVFDDQPSNPPTLTPPATPTVKATPKTWKTPRDAVDQVSPPRDPDKDFEPEPQELAE